MTKIEWTDETWNPVTGCNKVSQGCKNCYAEIMHRRQLVMNPHKYTKPFLAGPEIHPEELNKPLKWKKPRRVFVNSMSDLFHESVPFEFIDRVFSTMAICPHITFQILTKRPEIALRWSQQYDGPSFPLPNVWIGTSCEDQATADERIPLLAQIPAAVRFLSCEPLLGPIDLFNTVKWIKPGVEYQYPKIHWVIAGGESGHKARPVHPDWLRFLRIQCHSVKIPFFFKQWGEWLPLEDDAAMPFVRFVGDAVFYCLESKSKVCNFWKAGKSNTGNFLDGKQHLEFPQTKVPA